MTLPRRGPSDPILGQKKKEEEGKAGKDAEEQAEAEEEEENHRVQHPISKAWLEAVLQETAKRRHCQRKTRVQHMCGCLFVVNIDGSIRKVENKNQV